ncbi:MAG: hypothetical protein GX661_00135, partial [Acholeplasmataceae bacterium]|nr:hypothetical protein [Acholeplasmataceae bacterium]
MRYKGILLFVIILLLLGCGSKVDTSDEVEKALDAAISQVEIPSVIQEEAIALPDSINTVQIIWSTDHPEYISFEGVITRPEPEAGSQKVTLSATFSLAGVIRTVRYEVTVSAIPPEEIIASALASLNIGSMEAVTDDLNLPTSIGKVEVSWISSHPEYLDQNGKVKRPLFGHENVGVSLTASLSYLGKTASKIFSVTIISSDIEPFDYSKILGFACNIEPTLLEAGDPGYYLVSNEREFLEVLAYENNAKKGTIAAKVIEITSDLDLGYSEVLAKYPEVTFNDTIFREHKTPQTHPL